MAHTKVTKTYSQNTGAANTFSYSGSFDTFKATEVVVELDNVALTYTASTINESASPREYTVDYTNKTVHIGGADLSSGTVVIRPETDLGSPTPRAEFTPGASITSADLNNNQKQLLRRAMEYEETVLFTTGGTMTGDLTMDVNTNFIFEGATADAYETTLTVVDPTADRTITLPNVTGTVVTTGDTGTVTATMLAANSVDSSELVDGSIDPSHIASSAVTTGKIAADAVTGAKIADDAIDSEHYTDGSIDTAHIGAAQVTTAKLADDAVTTVKITDGNVTTVKIAADAVTTAKIADGAVTSDKIPDNAVTHGKMADNSVGTAELRTGEVTNAKLGADSVNGSKIADDSIDSEHLVDGSIDTAHIGDSQITSAKINDGTIVNGDINSSAAIAHSKLAALTDSQILVGNGSNVPTGVAVSGDVTIANTGAVTIAANAVEIGMIGCEQTTISDSDSHIPTSGAVVDYVAAQIAPIGGLEVIADEDNFPTTQPAAGVVISIADAGGVVFNGSGVSTTARTAGNGSDNVTINNAPSSLYSETLAAGVGMQVSSTGSSHTYNYHKILAKEADVKQLSDDINDFNSRYRVNDGEPSSNNDEGDLVYDTAANKMKVYDGSSWGEVTSTGDFKYLFLCPAGGSGAPTLDGSIATYDLRESSNSGSAASVTSAAQLMVSVNGVVQKANTGTSAPAEGFALVDSNTIIFGANLASGDSVFIIQFGSALTINTPGDGTVTAAKIANGSVASAKLADDAVTTAKIADDAITSAKIADNAILGNLIADNAIGAEHIEELDDDLDFADGSKAVFGSHEDLKIYHDGNNSYIEAVSTGTGDLIVQGTGKKVKLRPKSGEDGVIVIDDGAVELYYDDSKKFETTSAGATVTGTLTATLANNSIANAQVADDAIGVAELSATGTASSSTYLRGDNTWATVSGGGVTSDAQRNTIAGSNAGEDFDGSNPTDNTLYGYDAGKDITTGDQNTAIGSYALDAITTGSATTAVGWQACSGVTSGIRNTGVGWNALLLTTTGGMNTALGYGAGNQINSGGNNTCIGHEAANALNTGSNNTIMGYNSAYDLTTGSYNVCLGSNAGANLTTSGNNVAIGHNALQATTTVNTQIAIGFNALYTNTTGYDNVAIGYEALYVNDSGYQNTAVGNSCLDSCTSGDYNSALGRYAAHGITTGNNNIGVGSYTFGSACTGSNNIGVGYEAAYSVTSGGNNTCVGKASGYSLSTGSNNLLLGMNAGGVSSPSGTIDGTSNVVCLGNDQIDNLYCEDTSISSSDKRDKADVTNFTHGLNWVNQLNPVTYRWDKRSWYDDRTPDGSKKRSKKHIGLLAQDVLTVEGNPANKDDMLIVNLNEDDTRYGLKYERLVPVLINAIKELSTEVNTLKTKVAALEAG